MTEFPKEIFSKILTFIDYRDHRRVATDTVEEILDVGSINAELISQSIQLNNWLVDSEHPFSPFTQLREAIAREQRFHDGVITIDDWEELEEQFARDQAYEAELEEEYADYGYSNSEWSNRYAYHADRME
tara:strand:+ start:4211 stop:4600 length:390 start_codon:yes stop_codon:yes gene_type:complete